MLHLFDITNLITTYGYVGIFAIVFLESGVFFALPGDSLLFTAGIFASSGVLSIYPLVLGIFVSTLLGGLAGYYVGVNIERLRVYSFWRKILKQNHIDKSHEFFVKYGKTAIIFSRFVPIVRTFTPIVAGVARMNYRSFLKYSLISSALWSIIVTTLGFFLGNTFPKIKDYMPVVVGIVVILSILPAVFEVLRHKLSPGH